MKRRLKLHAGTISYTRIGKVFFFMRLVSEICRLIPLYVRFEKLFYNSCLHERVRENVQHKRGAILVNN